MHWLLSLGLCVAGLIAIVVEFFVPAGGLVGLLGFGSIIAGIVLSFVNYGTTVGTIFLVGAVLVTPGVIALYFRFFPGSFVGRWLILGGGQRREEGFRSYTTPVYEDLVGKEGLSLTILRPSGMVQIDGKKFSVVTSGDFIDSGETVQVVRVEGSRIVVKKGV